jgi:hypothetical protein
VETETALIRTKSRVELHTVSTVDLDLSRIVLPYNTELDDTFGDRGNWEGTLQFGGDLKELRRLEGRDKL